MQNSYSNASPRFTLRYQLTEELARQAGNDLWECRLARWKANHPEWGNAKPIWLLGLAALQVMIAMGALVWMNETLDTTDWVLLGAGGLVLLLILFKASFYALPFLGRWLLTKQSLRLLRSLDHHQIEWRLFDDHLETSSAGTQRSIPWNRITRLSQAGMSIILTLKDGLELMVPTSEVTPETRKFLESRVVSKEGRDLQVAG